MYTIYGIKNCNTMKKAFTLLDELKVPYAFHDYKKTGIDAATLQGWVETLGIDTVINRKGTTWRALSADEQAQAATAAGAIALMQAKPSVIKRPILSGPQTLLAGLDEAAYHQLRV